MNACLPHAGVAAMHSVRRQLQLFWRVSMATKPGILSMIARVFSLAVA